MTSITELDPTRVSEFKKAIRLSKKEAKVARTLMLDMLAVAYESEILIAYVYYDRANDILSAAVTRLSADAVYKAIMKDI